MIGRLVTGYLKWKYGGNVRALRPPLGFNKYQGSVPRLRRMAYRIKHGLWRVDRALFDKYGKPMRDNWDRAAFTAGNSVGELFNAWINLKEEDERLSVSSDDSIEHKKSAVKTNEKLQAQDC